MPKLIIMLICILVFANNIWAEDVGDKKPAKSSDKPSLEESKEKVKSKTWTWDKLTKAVKEMRWKGISDDKIWSYLKENDPLVKKSHIDGMTSKKIQEKLGLFTSCGNFQKLKIVKVNQFIVLIIDPDGGHVWRWQIYEGKTSLYYEGRLCPTE
jgi:hypothetical protein